MNFLLKNIELELDDKHLLAGEKLLAEGKIGGLCQSERNLWVANVGQFEVEMQITPSRVRDCSCECETFRQGQMCGHIAGGLMALRRLLAEKRLAASEINRDKPPLAYRKLTISSVLDNIGKEELAAFIGQYAKTNRQFALAIKARFAAAVPMHDPHEKYAQLLDSVLSISRKKNDFIGSASIRQLLQIIESLMRQSDDALALKHYTEALAILQATLVKIAPVVRKCEGDKSLMEAAVHTAFDKLGKLQDLGLPPALRAGLWDFHLQECTRPAYRMNNFSGRFFDLLLRLADSKKKMQTLLQTIDTELANKNNPATYQSDLMATKLKLFEKGKLKVAARSFLLACLSDTDLLFYTLETAMKAGLSSQAKSLAEKGLRFVHEAAGRKKLLQALVEIATIEKDRPATVEFSKTLFLETLDFEYYLRCKSDYEGDWAAFSLDLLAGLERLPVHAHFEILAQLYIEENSWGKLLELLSRHGSLDRLQQFDRQLSKSHPKEMTGLYKRYLKEYLSNHLGQKPTLRVRSLLNHLQQIQATAISTKLVKFLQGNFPERLAVVEELETF